MRRSMSRSVRGPHAGSPRGVQDLMDCNVNFASARHRAAGRPVKERRRRSPMQPRAAPWVWKTVAIESNSVRVRKEKASPTTSAFVHLNNVIQPRASPWADFANAFVVENYCFD